MRLSVVTSAVSEYFGDEGALRIIKQSGFDCCDFTFATRDGTEKIGDREDYVQWARHLRSVMDEIGLVCNQAHAPFKMHKETYSPTLKNREYRELVRSMECAAILGAPHIVVHALGREDDYDFDLKFYGDLEKWCERFNIRVAIENIYSHESGGGKTKGRIGDPETQMKLVRELGSKYFTALVDLGHAAITGKKPEDYIRAMDASILGGLHVHDTDFVGDLHLPPYHAKQDWDAIVKALADIGYEGDMSLEIMNYLRQFGKELLPDALCFSAKIGRELINKFESTAHDTTAV